MAIENILADLQRAKNAYTEQMKLAASTAFGAIFDEFPGLEFIFLRGYTPYFNDGDECTHFQYDPITDFSEYVDEIAYGDPEEEIAEYRPELYKGFKSNRELNDGERSALRQIFSQLEETLHSVYGTHWDLHITRAGVEQHEYTDHD